MPSIWAIRCTIAATTLTLLAGMATPADAHNTADLDTWVEEWDRLIADTGFDHDRLADWVGMANRHPAYFGRPVPHTHTPRAVSARVWSGSVEQWRPLVAAHFPAGQVDTALCIIRYESGGNPSIPNRRGSSALGLWQHLSRYWPARSAAAGVPGTVRTDPAAATIVAAWLWRSGGWGHWEVHRRCGV